jgi:ABC-2 type transport system permease protein
MILARLFWREHRVLVLGYTAILGMALSGAIWYWPQLRDAEIMVLMQFIPLEGLRDFARGFQNEGFWAYFGVQHLFRGAGMFGIAAAGLLGTGIVAREVENRTAELLLSRPLSRTRILLERWFSGALCLLLPLLVVTILAWWLAPKVEESLDLAVALKATLFTWLFPLMAFSATTFLSTFFSQQLKAGIIVLGIFLLQLALYFVPELWGQSIYNLIDLDSSLLFNRNEWPRQQTWVMLSISALFVVGALMRFRRRDF